MIEHSSFSPDSPEDTFSVPPVDSFVKNCTDAFLRDLSTLLAEHQGKVVAYAGDQQLGIDDDQFALEQRLKEEGHSQFETYSIALQGQDVTPASW